jgi:RNA polymerase sigma-54 factor
VTSSVWSQVCSTTDALVREAIAVIGRLEPKPGRRFVNVERNIVMPDVLVVQVGKGANVRFRAQINPR